MSGLPDEWVPTRIGDLGDLRLGKMLDRAKNDGLPAKYLRNINVRWFDFELGDLRTILVSEEEMTQLAVRDGDLFICEGGEPGRSAVWRNGANNLVYQKALHRFRTNGAVLPEFLMYRLRHEAEAGTLSDHFTGTTIKHLTGRSLAQVVVPVPPLEEQRRITDKLAALLARIDSCREHLDRVPGILKRFRQSVLAAATSGELTREWREERGRALDWPAAAIGDFLEGIEAGVNVKCIERPPAGDEKGLVKISAVTWGDYDDSESKTLPRGAAVPEATRIRVGDFLISRANTLELVGACTIVRQAPRPVYLSDKVLRLVVPHEWKPWLLTYLKSPVGRREIESRASGNQLSMRNLPQAKLREIPLPLPPADERDEIQRRVAQLLEFQAAASGNLARAAETLAALPPAALGRAFSGSLLGSKATATAAGGHGPPDGGP